MNTAKHLKDLNLQLWRKKSFLSWIKEFAPAVILASLLGTYLDLLFVGKNLYTFPYRPFPELFSVNIAFTLIGLPIMIFFYLYVMKQLNIWGKIGVTLFISIAMPVFERFAELLGFFKHSDDWEHIYTLFGYLVFLTIIYQFYHWTNNKK